MKYAFEQKYRSIAQIYRYTYLLTHKLCYYELWMHKQNSELLNKLDRYFIFSKDNLNMPDIMWKSLFSSTPPSKTNLKVWAVFIWEKCRRLLIPAIWCLEQNAVHCVDESKALNTRLGKIHHKTNQLKTRLELKHFQNSFLHTKLHNLSEKHEISRAVWLK